MTGFHGSTKNHGVLLMGCGPQGSLPISWLCEMSCGIAYQESLYNFTLLKRKGGVFSCYGISDYRPTFAIKNLF